MAKYISIFIKKEYFWDDEKGTEFWKHYEEMPFKQHDMRMWPCKDSPSFPIYLKITDENEVEEMKKYFNKYLEQ